MADPDRGQPGESRESRRRAITASPGPPPSLFSPTYLNSLVETVAYESATNSVRTPAETDLAVFWEPRCHAGPDLDSVVHYAALSGVPERSRR